MLNIIATNIGPANGKSTRKRANVSENGKSAWKMTQVPEKWQKYLEKGKMLRKLAKMHGKWQKYLENGKSTWKMARVSRPNVGLKQRLVSNLKCRTFSDVQMFLLMKLFSFSSICF